MRIPGCHFTIEVHMTGIGSYLKAEGELSAELTLFALLQSCAWIRAQCPDGAAEGATLCCSFEPLTSTVVTARPPYRLRQCVSVCLSFCVSLSMFGFFMCLTLW